MYEHVGVLIIY